MASVLLFATAMCVGGDDEEKLPDVGAVLRTSKEFAAKCKDHSITWADGVVRAQGEIAYRGGGPCEYLVGVYPAKAHETIVLLDKGPWKGDEERSRDPIRGLAEVLNNAFFAAGFKRGEPFDWDRKSGEVFAPKGETVHIYVEWKGKRALMSEWLWNFKSIEVMEPGKFVYTGSLIIDEGPPDHRKWLGAEVDGLVVAVLNTATALIDSTEDGSLDNGAYEAIAIRIPESGTRVTVAFSRKPLEVTEKYPPLKLGKELIEEKKRRAAEAARKKLDEPKK